MEELDEVGEARLVAEVLSPVGGAPIDLLNEDLCGGVPEATCHDVVEEAFMGESEVARFEHVGDDTRVDGGVGGLAWK